MYVYLVHVAYVRENISYLAKRRSVPKFVCTSGSTYSQIQMFWTCLVSKPLCGRRPCCFAAVFFTAVSVVTRRDVCIASFDTRTTLIKCTATHMTHRHCCVSNFGFLSLAFLYRNCRSCRTPARRPSWSPGGRGSSAAGLPTPSSRAETTS